MFAIHPHDDSPESTPHPGELGRGVKVKKHTVPRYLRIPGDDIYYARKRRYTLISALILLALTVGFVALAFYLASLGELVGGNVVLPGIVFNK